MYKKKYIAVIVPCYKVDPNIAIAVIKKIPIFVDIIYVVDDSCPFNTGKKIESKKIKRVKVLFNKRNIGVGGSIIKVYKKLKKKKWLSG